MGYYKDKQMDEYNPILMKFTDDFYQMLDKISIKNDLLWTIYSLDGNSKIKNGLGITSVDISDKESYVDIIIKDKPNKMKLVVFLKYFFGSDFTDYEYNKFVVSYNKVIKKNSNKNNNEYNIIPRKFKFEPKNIRDTFISLVTETYPMGHEEEVVPLITPGLNRDKHGNYYKIIGNSDTSFTCHLDTVSRKKEKISLIGYKKDDQEFIMSDGSTILGADDKSGVAIVMYMIAHNIPGVYWFFMGEERGGIGSGKVADDIESYPFMNKIKKMVSFDRRNYYSVITSQMGVSCCSNEFGQSLCEELNKSGLKINLDPTGVFTDSANFISLIPECTNVSVGYFNEHTSDEIQNMTYLERLAEACVNVNWDGLKITRKVGIDEAVMRKHSRLIKDIKKLRFYNDRVLSDDNGKLVISLEVSDINLVHLYRDLTNLKNLFSDFNMDPDLIFNEQFIKIELD